MPAANQPKGSVSTGSIKPVTRKAVRCQREVAWLVTQAAGKLVAFVPAGRFGISGFARA